MKIRPRPVVGVETQGKRRTFYHYTDPFCYGVGVLHHSWLAAFLHGLYGLFMDGAPIVCLLGLVCLSAACAPAIQTNTRALAKIPTAPKIKISGPTWMAAPGLAQFKAEIKGEIEWCPTEAEWAVGAPGREMRSDRFDLQACSLGPYFMSQRLEVGHWQIGFGLYSNHEPAGDVWINVDVGGPRPSMEDATR